MKLTPAAIVVSILVVGALAFFALRTKLEGGAANTKAIAEKKEGALPAGTDTSAAPGSAFTYRPAEPENGQLHGVVELGASGFNSFVVNMDSQKRWKLVTREFGQSLALEGRATTESIRQGLNRYLFNMFHNGVASPNMHFVVSSGALKQPKTVAIANELVKMGYRVNRVTNEQEARFVYMATVPPPYFSNSFMLDIGSGNTKLAWDEAGAIRTMELPGSRYFERGVTDEEAYATVKQGLGKLPPDRRKFCFVTGGVPATLARQHRRGSERYTVLRPPTAYTPADKKTAAGLNIYKAITDSGGTGLFVFDDDTNFTIGFLMTLSQ